jgi:hypothetical protein
MNGRMSNMKIIQTDNYCRESVADILIAENVNKYYGKIIIKFLNKNSNNSYFILEKDDYRLSRGLADLI